MASTAWRACVPEDGSDVYYFNLDTGDTSWGVPAGMDAAAIPEFGVEDEVAAGTRDVDNAGADGEHGAAGSAGDAGAAAVAIAVEKTPETRPRKSSISLPRSPPAAHTPPIARAAAVSVPPVAAQAPAPAAAAVASTAATATPPPPAVAAPAAAPPPTVPPSAAPQPAHAAGAGAGAGAGADAGSSAGVAPSTAASLPPWTETPRNRCWITPSNPVSKLWEEHRTESFGNVEGEKYYVNRETGETVWEAPEGYHDTPEVACLAGIDADTPVTDVLRALDLTDRAVASTARAMRDTGGVDVSLLRDKIHALFAVLQSHGSDREWKAVVAAGDLALPRLVFSWWCSATPPDVAVHVARVLVLMSSFVPAVMVALVDGTFAPFAFTLQGVAVSATWAATAVHSTNSPSRASASASNALSSPSAADVEDAPNEEQLATWVVFLQQLCDAAHGVQPPLKKAGLPPPEAVRRLVDHLLASRVEAYNGAARALASLSALYTDSADDAVVAVCARHTASASFAQALIHDLNEASGSSDVASDPTATHRVLAFTQRLLRFQSDIHSFFYTNDLKVLIDIIVRELQDLGPGDTLRVEYLELLRVLLLHSQWAEMGYYRRDDILSAIESIFDGAAHSTGLLPKAREAAERMLVDCAPLLE